jgi:hypothetical protein
MGGMDAPPPVPVTEAHVVQLVQMGFQREPAERALAASFDNVEAAANALASGAFQ